MKKVKNKFIMAVVAFVMAWSAEATDIRIKSGALLPNSVLLSTATATGLEISGYTSPRTNGINWGIAFGGVLADGSFQDGGYVYLNIEVMYRLKKKLETYLVGGTLFQSYNEYDYGYGWEYGGGVRYVWCNGVQIGAEFLRQDVTFQSNQSSTLIYDGETRANHNFIGYLGYRF